MFYTDDVKKKCFVHVEKKHGEYFTVCKSACIDLVKPSQTACATLTARAPSSTDYIIVTADYITVTADYTTVTADYKLHTPSVVLPQADRSHWATNQLNNATCRLYGF